MADPDELAQLEMERARLLSIIAYHSRSMLRTSPWLMAAAIGLLCGGVVFAVVAIASIQNSVLFIGFVGLSGYILTRKVTVFGITIPVFAIITLSPGGPSAGETETRRRLADCEARIAKLKEGHS